MVATGGKLLLQTKPFIWTHSPGGNGADSYDFDGNPAHIYKIVASQIRTAGNLTVVYLTIPGIGILNLLQIYSQGVANPLTDGESQSEEVNLCIDVPPGAVLNWTHTGSTFLTVLFDFK